MAQNNRMWFNQYGQLTADNKLLNAEDVKPDVINGATGEAVIPNTPTGVGTGSATGTATGGTGSDPVKDFYGNYLAEQEKLTNDFYAGVVKGLEDKEKAAQDYYAGVVADINQREQEAQNYYRNAMVLAMTDMEKARQTFGAKAEELAQAGLSDSGLSDYAARQFYSAYVNEKQAIRGEENAAMGALAAERADAAAKHKLDLASIADEKSKAAFEQQGALSDLSYQRAEYEAGKQATTETEKDAAEQKGIAAYNALSLLMSPTDAEGNEKTALSYRDAVQALANQGVDENAIKDATSKYVDSIRTGINAAISSGNTVGLMGVTEQYLTENGFTPEDAAQIMSKVQEKRYEGIHNIIKNSDHSAMKNLLASMGFDQSALKETSGSDVETLLWNEIYTNQNGIFSSSERERLIKDNAKNTIHQQSDATSILEAGAQFSEKYGENAYNAFAEVAETKITNATRVGNQNRRITVSIAGKTFNLDTDVKSPKVENLSTDYAVGTLYRENNDYFVLYDDGKGNKSWRQIDWGNGLNGNTRLTEEQTAILKKLFDKHATFANTDEFKVTWAAHNANYTGALGNGSIAPADTFGSGKVQLTAGGTSYTLGTKNVGGIGKDANAYDVGTIYENNGNYYIVSGRTTPNGKKQWQQIVFQGSWGNANLSPEDEAKLKKELDKHAIS